ncbi:MMPL family transporter [Lactobacillaceae bacterium Scapto_B20]
MQLFKRINSNWLIIIVLWIVAVFFAIAKLPNITNLITNDGQPQFNNSSQIIKAQQLQNSWGRGINGSTSLNVVYNNPNGKITNQQQAKINTAVQKLQNNRSLDIKKVTTINNNPNGRLPLFSNDQTTQIVSLNVGRQYNVSNAAVSKLQEQMSVSGLNTYVTSPAIINNVNAQKMAANTKTITIVTFIIVTILMALFFRSIVAPIISGITLAIAYVTSLSLIGNLVIHQHLAFASYLPIILTLLITILGSWFNFMIIRAANDEVASHRNNFNATTSGLKHVIYPIIATSAILIVGFAATYFMPFSSIKAIASLAIVTIIIMLATLTITPIFTSLLGAEVLWPSHQLVNLDGHRSWAQLAKLSLWQPIIGLLLVAYFVGPFAYSYRNNIIYNNQDDAKSSQQAIVGARILQAHFSQGKATPITIYIHNNQPLNQQAALEKIDSLTTKLKSVDNVNAVYSVTQPSGIPINKYYVQSQLNSITKRVDQSQVTLAKNLKQVKTGQKHIKTNSLSAEMDTISELQSAASSLIDHNQQLASQLNSATSHTNSTSQRTSSKQVRSYQRQLNELNQTLTQAATSLSAIQSQGQTISSSSDKLSTKLNKYADSLRDARDVFTQIGTATKSTNQKLDAIYDYLDGLAKSSVGAVYYITPLQLADTDFQQSLYNYNSSDNKTTQLSVILQNSSDNPAKTEDTIQNIQKNVDVMLQGTSLQAAHVYITGQPVQQTELKAELSQFGLLVVGLMALIALIILAIISRSLLHPIYWLITFGVSLLAGLQLTSMTTHFDMGNNQTNWQAVIIASIVFASVAISELSWIAIGYRKRELPFFESYHAVIVEHGKVIQSITGLTLITAISLLFINNQAIQQAGLIIGYAIVIFNVSFPIISVALSKLAEYKPQKAKSKPE